MSIILFLTILAITANCCNGAAVSNEHSYSVVIDAGSSGTRLWVYKWQRDTTGKLLPNYKMVSKKKNLPSLASYAGNKDELKKTVDEMLGVAKQTVPEKELKKTPIFLFATAGMRFLSEENANKVFDDLREMLDNISYNPFYFERHNARILSGEEEGVFAWIAVNYLTGALRDPTRTMKTSGILELGGASTQIAFVPKSNILADKFPVSISGEKYPLYAHSYLYFGQEYVDLWVMEYLSNNTNLTTLKNPCLLSGDSQTYNSTSDVTFEGSGDPHECAHILGRLVEKVNPRYCHPKPCAIGKVYQPSIYPDQEFYALSVFPKVLKELGVLNDKNTFTPASLFERSYEYCRKDFNLLKKDEPTKRWKFISKPCLMGVFTALLFTKGYGFKNDTHQIIGSEDINNVTADWTLGALIYEQSSSSCPDSSPAHNAGSSLRPSAIFISVPQFPPLPRSFSRFLQMSFCQTGSQPAVAILIYLVFSAILK